MMYLKFIGKNQEGPLRERVIATREYDVVYNDDDFQIYYKPGQWERVGPNDWLNCFVMSESGKTIDKIEPPPF